MIITSVTQNNLKSLAKTIQQKWQLCQILAKNPSKIINHNILHTPSNVGVMIRKTFSNTLDEAMSGGLVKACDLRENLFCNLMFYLLQDLNYLERQAFNRFSCPHQVLKTILFGIIFSDTPLRYIKVTGTNIFFRTWWGQENLLKACLSK